MNRQILEEAAAWFVEFNTGEADARTRQRFDRWLRTSPEHLRAYLALLPTWDDAAAVDSPESMSADEVLAWVRQGSNIVSIPASQGPAGGTALFGRLRSPRLLMAACAVALCASTATVGWWFSSQPPVYATQVGEQRSLTLPDGSTVELNARSRVRIRFSAKERAVELMEGQALFRVAKDPQRPFRVQSADARVQAVGTQFDVYKRDSGTTVTVLEGRIEVWSGAQIAQASAPTAGPRDNNALTKPAALASGLLLDVGEQVTVADGSVAHPKHADVQAATAWTQRELVFKKVSLREVAEEFNRYSRRPLKIEDPRVQQFTISGIFSSTDTASLLRFLRAQPDLTVAESGDTILVTAKTRPDR
jgi:transmembrane sensor